MRWLLLLAIIAAAYWLYKRLNAPQRKRLKGPPDQKD